MLQNIAAKADIWLGLLAIPALAAIYVAESAKFAGFRQKSADGARRLVRFAALRPFLTIFGSKCVGPADGENAVAVTAAGDDCGRSGDPVHVTAVSPAVEAGKRIPTTVLITEQEVAFSTAAALSVPPARTRRRRLSGPLIAARLILTAPPEPRPHYRHEPGYFERARMSREMDRL
jgi:hypothetical protein